MADHSIDTGEITDLEGNTINDPDVLDAMFTDIVTQYNGSLHATTGHSHAGTTGNGPSISSGVGSLTVTELGRLFFSYGGIT